MARLSLCAVATVRYIAPTARKEAMWTVMCERFSRRYDFERRYHIDHPEDALRAFREAVAAEHLGTFKFVGMASMPGNKSAYVVLFRVVKKVKNGSATRSQCPAPACRETRGQKGDKGR